MSIFKYSDTDLVKGCVNNERKCQERLYRKFFHKAMGIAMSFSKDKRKALEIVNQGFLKVFRKIHTLEDVGALDAWVGMVVRRACADYFRSEQQYFKRVSLHEKLPEKTVDDSLSHLYFKDIIHLLDRLPPATAEVFRLYAVEGYKHREIAQWLGISEGTSKWHLSAARSKLRELLQTPYGMKKDEG